MHALCVFITQPSYYKQMQTISTTSQHLSGLRQKVGRISTTRGSTLTLPKYTYYQFECYTRWQYMRSLCEFGSFRVTHSQIFLQKKTKCQSVAVQLMAQLRHFRLRLTLILKAFSIPAVDWSRFSTERTRNRIISCCCFSILFDIFDGNERKKNI